MSDLKQELAEFERLQALVESLRDLTEVARGMVPDADNNGDIWTYMDNNFYNADHAVKIIAKRIDHLRKEIEGAG